MASSPAEALNDRKAWVASATFAWCSWRAEGLTMTRLYFLTGTLGGGGGTDSPRGDRPEWLSTLLLLLRLLSFSCILASRSDPPGEEEAVLGAILGEADALAALSPELELRLGEGLGLERRRKAV